MDANAKKVSIIIIVILIGIIGGLWYIGNRKNNASPAVSKTDLLVATSTDIGFDLRTYANGQKNIEEIVVDKLVAGVPSTTLVSLPSKATPVSAAKIISSNNTSPDFLKTYGQKIAEALAPYNKDQINETAVMLEALEQKDPVKAQSLANLAQANKQIVSNLLKISVPKTAVSIHLELVNNLNQNTVLLTDMSKILDNPYTALESANIFKVQKLNFYKSLNEINQFFKTNNIIFSPEEGSKIYVTI